MLAEERRLTLLEWTISEGRVDAAEAAKRLDVAVETIRRDLDTLQRQGSLRRVHGGAITARQRNRELNMPERRVQNTESKLHIAELAASFLPDEGSVFVDGGTTTGFLVGALKRKKNLIVITNNVELAAQLGEAENEVYLVGGRIRKTTLTTLGSRAVEEFGMYRANIAFLGANGFSPTSGFTTTDPDESAVKKVMIANSLERIVLADSAKMGAVYATAFANTDVIDKLITDSGISKSAVEAFTAAGVEVVTAQP